MDLVSKKRKYHFLLILFIDYFDDTDEKINPTIL